MPTYEFLCKKCENRYSSIERYDETGKYKDVKCPHCKSKSKKKLVSGCAHAFAQPEGTGKWNNGTYGHDYRFKHKLPQVLEERKRAEMLSHMGNPYGNAAQEVEADLNLGEGIHDPETRKGLS